MTVRVRLAELATYAEDGEGYAFGMLPSGPAFRVQGPGVLWLETLRDTRNEWLSVDSLLDRILADAPEAPADARAILLRELEVLRELGAVVTDEISAGKVE
ncbi:hypothetical protein KRX56_00250 [Dermabacteraceae bacterium TAE3-ERU27]|nr:hypothetical protein [Dermabacteraceae bacterium TAE3-ERU27]